MEGVRHCAARRENKNHRPAIALHGNEKVREKEH